MASSGPFLIVGASGPTGGIVARAVAAHGGAVRGLCRSAQSAERALDGGAHETAIGDLRAPASLVAAMEGTAGAFYFSPRAEPDEASLGRTFIAAAERAGVPRVVIISMVQSHAPVPNHRASLEVEAALSCTSIQHVVLQPGMFMQTLPSLEQIAELGWVGRPYPPNRPLTWVDMGDIAEVAAQALMDDDLVNGTFELCASGMTSIREIAELMSDHLGRPIDARQITLEEWAAVRGEDFASPYRRECYAAMFEHFAQHGYKGGNSFILRQLLGREPTTWTQYIARGGRTASLAPVSASVP
jgi:uncharacterized protein YbjT (DUF2867 family)